MIGMRSSDRQVELSLHTAALIEKDSVLVGEERQNEGGETEGLREKESGELDGAEPPAGHGKRNAFSSGLKNAR
jgi:hypothetical protein